MKSQAPITDAHRSRVEDRGDTVFAISLRNFIKACSTSVVVFYFGEAPPHPGVQSVQFFDLPRNFTDLVFIYRSFVFRSVQFCSFLFRFVHFLQGLERQRRRRRGEGGKFFETRLLAGLAVEKEFGGDVIKVAPHEFLVDLAEFIGDVGEFLFVAGNETLAGGFPAGEGEVFDLVGVLVSPLGGEADGDFEDLADLAIAEFLGAELDELVDGVLGVHMSILDYRFSVSDWRAQRVNALRGFCSDPRGQISDHGTTYAWFSGGRLKGAI